MNQHYTINEAFKLARQGYKMRCISFGLTCGFIIVSENNIVKTNFGKILDDSLLTNKEYKSTWIILE